MLLVVFVQTRKWAVVPPHSFYSHYYWVHLMWTNNYKLIIAFCAFMEILAWENLRCNKCHYQSRLLNFLVCLCWKTVFCHSGFFVFVVNVFLVPSCTWSSWWSGHWCYWQILYLSSGLSTSGHSGSSSGACTTPLDTRGWWVDDLKYGLHTEQLKRCTEFT